MNDSEFAEIDEAVKRLIQGDESARQQLIQLSYDRLKRLTRKMLKDFPTVHRWEDTDDVFQRAAMRLWKSLAEVQPESSRHYFNLAALHVRRELIELARSYRGPLGPARNLESVAGCDSETVRDAIDNAGSDTYEASSLATWNEFHEKVQLLESSEREIFELIWYQGLSQETVSRLLGASQKTISRRWQKARRNIFELVGRQLPQ
jgi:RNA polymerase sigma-70 factor (ECF subfamily)